MYFVPKIMRELNLSICKNVVWKKINGARMYIKSRLCHSLIDIYRVLYIQIAEMCRRESTLS